MASLPRPPQGSQPPSRIGALFAGYGGLDMAVSEVLGAEMVWYSEVDKGALKILGHRFPDVPNVGDVTTADWSQVEPIDILTGGSPCQDLSHAGKRQGMTEGTRSNLWVAMREAIAQLRPATVVWENVRGAFSAAADSDLESDPRLLADVRRRDGQPVLRALGRVLGDLSDLGYDCRWHGMRAADIGAPHGRFRVFVVASDASRIGGGSPWTAGREPLGPDGVSGAGQWVAAVTDAADLGHERPRGARDGRTGPPHGDSGAVALLPTPAAQEPGGTLTDYHARLKAHDGRESSFAPLSMAVQRMPPAGPGSPYVDCLTGRQLRCTHSRCQHQTRWGQYAVAIARWEHTLGRPAPAPTMTSTKGNPQLSPVFVEWLMGLPAGWVTDVPGITRNEALKALGAGVVPQQAAAALRTMLAWEVAA